LTGKGEVQTAAGEFREIPPRASAVLQSLRAVGYDLPTAVADILDNSLAAGASHLGVDLRFDGSNSHVRIEDDGGGMTGGGLDAAMRLGSMNPSAVRASTDHGRFGLGLKTASFSQCKRLTVRTRTKGGPLETRSWDLDHVETFDVWALRVGTWDVSSEARLGTIPEDGHGTIVLWEKLDRVVEQPKHPSAHADFDRKILETRDHLSLVFHRLIDATNSPLDIRVNGTRLEGWDPLFSRHPQTRQKQTTKLALGGSAIQVYPYIIPPESRLAPEDARRAAGPRGWLAHQGFYLYRNRRLLVTGGWLGLARKDPQCSLARIRLDVDNRLDDLLRIDVRKARARIPDQVRERVQKIVDKTRKAAAEEWRTHAVTRTPTPGAKGPIVPVWLMDASESKTTLRVNPKHPVIESMRARLGEEAPSLDALLSLVSSSVPVDVLLQMAGAAQPPAPTQESEKMSPELQSMMRDIVRFMKLQGLAQADIISRLTLVEPWSSIKPSTLASLVEHIK
jgi:hypothetical protein